MSEQQSEQHWIMEPATDHPGWLDWNLRDSTLFNSAVLGRLLVRKDTENRATVRMFPERKHSNLLGVIHGGTILGFMDVALFGAGRQLGLGDVLGSVTLDLGAQFIGAGKMDEPLDANIELLRETGRFMFMQGKIIQGDHIVASFNGTVKKPSTKRPKPTSTATTQ